MGRLIDVDDFINWMIEAEKSASENEKYDNGDNIEREMWYSTASLRDTMKYYAPPIDAVRVVRCRDCTSRETPNCGMADWRYEAGTWVKHDNWNSDDDFCSCGVKNSEPN